MAEEFDDGGFPGAQASTFIKGDQYVFRAADGPGLRDVIKSAAETGDDILDELAKFKQVAIAKSVFTGDGQSGGGSSASTSTAKRSGGSRAADSPPPSGDIEYYEKGGKKWATGDGIDCTHGPRVDLRDGNPKTKKKYAADLYCSLETDDFKEKCKPIKL